MKAAIAIVIAVILFCIIQWQITSVTTQQRKTNCETVVYKGQVLKANDYEYYSCLSKE